MSHGNIVHAIRTNTYSYDACHTVFKRHYSANALVKNHSARAHLERQGKPQTALFNQKFKAAGYFSHFPLPWHCSIPLLAVDESKLNSRTACCSGILCGFILAEQL
jgi:hypothetical protein